MLVQIMQNGESASRVMNCYKGANRGYAVQTDTQNAAWTNKVAKLMQFNRSPSEKDVQNAAHDAGAASTAAVLFRDYVNYRMETVTKVADMHKAEMSAMGRMAGISAGVAQAQDKMTQQFAQAAYQIGNSHAYTQGVTNAYANGLNAASRIM